MCTTHPSCSVLEPASSVLGLSSTGLARIGPSTPSGSRIASDQVDPDEYSAIQPTILVHSTTELQILCRSQQGLITQAWSTDGGVTWGPMSPTDLPNPSAGIDGLRLRDGRFLLVYNPTTRGRRRLAVAVSDDGRSWRRAVALENAPNGEYSYPAMIQTADGLVHVTYTWRRQRIRHVVVDPSQIE